MNPVVDYLIVGAGIVGLSIARELKTRQPNCKILILEKEAGLGRHASGRNSGVLHSGIFYAEDSVKARVCAEGGREMVRYCHENGLPIRKTGKVIVPLDPSDEARLTLLHDRGKRNHISVEIVDSSGLKRIEPDVTSFCGKALYLPEVCVIDPTRILTQLASDLKAKGVEIQFNHPFEILDNLQYGHLFNTAGLQADRIAKTFGVGDEYTILPFKGLYYRIDPNAPLRIQGLIYAMPDPRVPFLGIHYSRTVTDDVTLGPTVVPAFGRENYRGLSGIAPLEALTIARELAILYCHNKFGFRTFAHREALRFMKRSFYDAARKLVPKLRIEHLLPSEKVGIRAQLVNHQNGELVMDFLVKSGKNSTHILNAVSPAFTSAFAFAKLILDQLGIH